MALTVTDALNSLNSAGFFSYVIPFLLIFAVVFAILKQTRILGEEKPILTIVAAAIGLLSLQFDLVSVFFANIFPKFGVGLAILLVVLIFLAFMGVSLQGRGIKAMGWIVAGAVVIWALLNWNTWWSSGLGFGWWFQEYFWAIIILAIVIGAVFWVSKGGKSSGGSSGKSGKGGSS